MITEQEAREAAEILAEFGSEHEDSTEGGAAQVLTNWTRQEIARRDADRAERAKPIDAEWCSANGAQLDELAARWNIDDETYVVWYRQCGSVYVGMYDEVDFIPFRAVKTAGQIQQLLDLLAALKGGET